MGTTVSINFEDDIFKKLNDHATKNYSGNRSLAINKILETFFSDNPESNLRNEVIQLRFEFEQSKLDIDSLNSELGLLRSALEGIISKRGKSLPPNQS